MKGPTPLLSERNRMIALAFSLFLMLPLSANAQNNEEQILDAVSKVFEGINTANGDMIRSVMAPSAILYASSFRNGGPVAGLTTAEQFAAGVSDPEQGFVERIFDPEVRIQEGVASVWAPYDFHIHGEFSHCGIDIISLVHMPEGWKVASVVYTVERENCPARPDLDE